MPFFFAGVFSQNEALLRVRFLDVSRSLLEFARCEVRPLRTRPRAKSKVDTKTVRACCAPILSSWQENASGARLFQADDQIVSTERDAAVET
jgi:hypothetical protein